MQNQLILIGSTQLEVSCDNEFQCSIWPHKLVVLTSGRRIYWLIFGIS